MIMLTHLNDMRFVPNAELIRTIEENPHTTIMLTGGDCLIMREWTAQGRA